MESGPDPKLQNLKDQFIEARGYWSPVLDDMLRLSPEYFDAYLKFSSVPWRTGTLPPKVRELIYIAIDSSTTHLYAPGLGIHIPKALSHGATPAEIMEVFQLTSVLGVHTVTSGVPVLLDELRKAGLPTGVDEGPLAAEQEELKRQFTENRGYWSDLWDSVIRLSPEFFAAYMEFSSVPWLHGTLEPKVRELIYIAIDSATTHLYEPGLRVHIRNALRYGATAAEIMEVYQLVASLGIHTLTVGVPVLVEAMETAAKLRIEDRAAATSTESE